MSKLEDPPAYEDAIHSPKYANYPPQPPYGHPGYGGGCHPQPPLSTYGPGPGMYPSQQPVFRGQPGGYPPPGMVAGPRYQQSRMPPIIPTLSAGVPGPGQGDMEDFMNAQWESIYVRHAFIRKVYLILAAQLSVTVSIVAVFTFIDPVRLFVIQNPGIYWASFAVYFVVYCVLICCKEPRRRFPWNLVLLSIFTLAMSYMTGTIASYYETKAVFLAIGITAIVCVVVTIFCFQTKVDFTSCGGLMCILAVLVMIIGVITAIVLSFQYVPWLHMLYAAIGAIVYTLFLAYNTQLLIGNRQLAISPEEYIYGALSLYIDIVQIFLFILQIGGAATE